MAFFTLFIVIHVSLVFVVHPKYNLTHMMLGEGDPARFAQALTMTILGIAVVVGIWLFLSLGGVSRPCATRRSSCAGFGLK